MPTALPHPASLLVPWLPAGCPAPSRQSSRNRRLRFQKSVSRVSRQYQYSWYQNPPNHTLGLERPKVVPNRLIQAHKQRVTDEGMADRHLSQVGQPAKYGEVVEVEIVT